MTDLKLSYFNEYRIYELSEIGVVPQRTERYYPAFVCSLKISDNKELEKIEDILEQLKSDYWIFSTLAVTPSSVVVAARTFNFETVIAPEEWPEIERLEKEFANAQFEKTNIPNLGMEYIPKDVEFPPSFRDGVPILNQDFFRKARNN